MLHTALGPETVGQLATPVLGAPPTGLPEVDASSRIEDVLEQLVQGPVAIVRGGRIAGTLTPAVLEAHLRERLHDVAAQAQASNTVARKASRPWASKPTSQPSSS